MQPQAAHGRICKQIPPLLLQCTAILLIVCLICDFHVLAACTCLCRQKGLHTSLRQQFLQAGHGNFMQQLCTLMHAVLGFVICHFTTAIAIKWEARKAHQQTVHSAMTLPTQLLTRCQIAFSEQQAHAPVYRCWLAAAPPAAVKRRWTSSLLQALCCS